MGRTLLRAMVDRGVRRSSAAYDTFTFNGVTYPLGMYQPQPSLGQTRDDIQDSYTDYARYAYGANAAIRTLVDRRRQVFSQGRFRFQQMRGGVPGDFFGTPALDVLDGPGRTDSGQDLMSQALQDADLAGTAVIVRERGPRLVCLRPDWVTIVAGSRRDDVGMVAPDAEVLGIVYHPGGRDRGGADPVVYLPGEFTLFRYAPDPAFRFKGISWISSVVKEVQADTAATTHKLMFFENGATPATIVTLDPAVVKTVTQFEEWVNKFEERHDGLLNAYKTLYMGAGADVEVVGSDLKQLDFKVTQGAGETRLAAAAGVPPIIAGFSEGLAAATYSNYGQARRAFSDITIWDLWGKMANALESVIPPPGGARMWVDSRHIPFLQDDALDDAEIMVRKANAMRTLWDGGAEPESVIKAVEAGDLSQLEHSGNLSVQLQDPSAPKPDPTPEPPPEPTDGKRAVERAREQLRERGIPRPTQAQVAEHLGVSDRTVRRWEGEAA